MIFLRFNHAFGPRLIGLYRNVNFYLNIFVKRIFLVHKFELSNLKSRSYETILHNFWIKF
ncbi:hypothetical protein GCM10022258_35890 [Aquimarina gracilis]